MKSVISCFIFAILLGEPLSPATPQTSATIACTGIGICGAWYFAQKAKNISAQIKNLQHKDQLTAETEKKGC